MTGIIENLIIGGYDCLVYFPHEYSSGEKSYPVVYMNGNNDVQEIISNIEPHFNTRCQPFILISISPRSWNDDFTPWTGVGLQEKDEPFGGNASAYLSFLANAIKPFVDANYRTKPEPKNTALIGYSLAGLAALYSLYISSEFGRVASISGSLWYDGYIEFMRENNPINVNAKVYLSLGKNEENSKNTRMAKVGNCTRSAFEVLEAFLSSKDNITLEWNNGGHFTEVQERFTRALLWLMKL